MHRLAHSLPMSISISTSTTNDYMHSKMCFVIVIFMQIMQGVIPVKLMEQIMKGWRNIPRMVTAACTGIP